MGYDIDRIAETTPDHMKEYHPQLGWTYKVCIRSESTSKSMQQIRAMVLKRVRDVAGSRSRSRSIRPSLLDDAPDNGDTSADHANIALSGGDKTGAGNASSSNGDLNQETNDRRRRRRI